LLGPPGVCPDKKCVPNAGINPAERREVLKELNSVIVDEREGKT